MPGCSVNLLGVAVAEMIVPAGGPRALRAGADAYRRREVVQKSISVINVPLGDGIKARRMRRSVESERRSRWETGSWDS